MAGKYVPGGFVSSGQKFDAEMARYQSIFCTWFRMIPNTCSFVLPPLHLCLWYAMPLVLAVPSIYGKPRLETCVQAIN